MTHLKRTRRLKRRAFSQGYNKAEKEKNAEIRAIRKAFQNEIDLYDKRDFERIKAHRKKMIRLEKLERQAIDRLNLADQTLARVETIRAEADQQADNLKIRHNNILILGGHSDRIKNEIEKQKERIING